MGCPCLARLHCSARLFSVCQRPSRGKKSAFRPEAMPHPVAIIAGLAESAITVKVGRKCCLAIAVQGAGPTAWAPRTDDYVKTPMTNWPLVRRSAISSN